MKRTASIKVRTSHGTIAVETAGAGFPIVFIHGNSAFRAVLQKRTTSRLRDDYRLISFDLPGSDHPDDAVNRGRTCPRPGLADLVIELLEVLDIDYAAIVGISLGGHIAIEMLSRCGVSRGQFLVGTPALDPPLAEGLVEKPLNGLASRGELTPEETQEFAQFVLGSNFERFMRQAIERADLEFRGSASRAARNDAGIDRRALLDPANVDGTRYENLRRANCFRILGTTHSPFWEIPHIVNRLSSEFFKELTGMRSN